MTTGENRPDQKYSRRSTQVNADKENSQKKSAKIGENRRQKNKTGKNLRPKNEKAKILRIERIFSGYQKRKVLRGVSLEIAGGETVAVIGKNGAGKSTLIKAIMGFLPVWQGDIFFKDDSITNKPPYYLQKKGIGYFMQGGRIFPHLTIQENIEVAGIGLTKAVIGNKIRAMSEMLPVLKNRRKNVQAGSLSGGERQQLALSMVLLHDLDLILLDEPSAGLSPVNVDKMYEILDTVKASSRLSLLLIEQKISEAVKFSDRVCLLKNGQIERQEQAKALENIEDIGNFFFGSLESNGLA